LTIDQKNLGAQCRRSRIKCRHAAHLACALSRPRFERASPALKNGSEDIAGVLIVGLIAYSAAVAAYQAIDRLLHPQPITDLGWVMAAGILGFGGNEVVAVFRIRVGKEIGSAALIADGYHARTDGFTSLAVVIGAAGVYLGWPMADPIIGLAITSAILGIVWQSAREDGVEPEIVERLVKAAHLYGVRAIKDVRVRWLGHKLEAELAIAVDGKLSTQASHGITEAVKRALLHAEPKLRSVLVCVHPQDNDPQAKA
jgi:cation diffusion facilitator family transporter